MHHALHVSDAPADDAIGDVVDDDNEEAGDVVDAHYWLTDLVFPGNVEQWKDETPRISNDGAKCRTSAGIK